MSLEELIERDVLTVVKLRDGMSYTDISEMLCAYDREQVFHSIGKLCGSGALRVTEKGFVAQEGDDLSGDGRADCVTGAARQSDEVAERVAGELAEKPKPVLERASEPDALRAATEVLSWDFKSMADETRPAEESQNAQSIEDEREVSQVDAVIQAGTVLTSTPLAALGFEADFVEMAHGRRLYTVFELVRSLDSLQMSVKPKALACVVRRLVDLSGDPPLKLKDDQVKSLKHFALSACFYFDWFGVLCTSLPKNTSEEEIKKFIKSGGLARNHQRKFYLQEFTKNYPSNSVSVAAKLRAELSGKRYPVNGDAFDICMVPTVCEWFESGECEDDEEALKLGMELLESRIQVEHACYGFLRDKFNRIHSRKKAGERVGSIHVVDGPVFLTAAKRFAEDEPAARFDVEGRKLYCAAVPRGRAGK